MKTHDRLRRFALDLLRYGEIVKKEDWFECGKCFTSRTVLYGGKRFIVDHKAGELQGVWFYESVKGETR